MIHVAFPLIGRGVWTGGFAYLKNTLRLIATRLRDRMQASVMLTPEEAEKFGAEIKPLAEGRLIVDPAFEQVGRGKSLLRAVALGRDAAVARIMREHRIDAAFEVANFLGWRPGVPTVAWIPDLQHRFMPQMFPRGNWWRRELGFRAQIMSGRTIMVSSETARADCERFYPGARGRIRVVRFAVEVEPTGARARSGELRAKYDLPERYFYLPNQFWQHKNHALVVDALARLKAEGALAAIPPIILSGHQRDPRNPSHFDDLTTRAKERGIASHFRYLGLIPFEDVLGLTANCDRMINPSLFEGWSTPIEEAKALGAPLLLSDLRIHREQAPDAHFFDPHSAEACARALREIASDAPPVRSSGADLVAAQNLRLEAHAQALFATFEAAVGRKI